jgi:prevent-host-death family protein
MEISVKEARSKLSSLVDRAEQGGEIIISRRGKKVARLVPLTGKRSFPSLKEFRASIRVAGEPLSATVVRNREEERY